MNFKIGTNTQSVLFLFTYLLFLLPTHSISANHSANTNHTKFVCTAPVISSFFPLSGPENTLVTISGSGFQAGTGVSAVRFNGISAALFTVISDSVIKVYVPAGTATGIISVVSDSCEGFASAPFTEIVTNFTGNYSSDIYISELYDARLGDGGVIEIYNGTPNAVNLSNYTLRRYGDIGVTTSFYTIQLVGTLPAGGIHLIGIGGGTIPCRWTPSQGQRYPTGFNSDDEFELFNNSVLIDNVHTPGAVGFSMIRNPNAVAPKTVFNGSDWNTSPTENCANIGVHSVPTVTPPVVANPVSKNTCEGNVVLFSVSLVNPTTYNYQWKMIGTSGVWANVSGSAYLGATSPTLTINNVPAAFDANQYYCQITKGTDVFVSNAAQLEVTAKILPDFPTSQNICPGGTVPVLASRSPNNITGHWTPSTVSNTVSGIYRFDPDAGQCAQPTNFSVSVGTAIVPDFPTAKNLCPGDAAPVLANRSPNNITGQWTPPTVSNTISGVYRFDPDAGQCAQIVNFSVTVGTVIIPDFPTSKNLCPGDAAPVLASRSPNNITGHWTPSTVSNTVSGVYRFDPDAGQCAQAVNFTVTIGTAVVPNFPASQNLCPGDRPPVLSNRSPNNITGNWTPSTVSNTISGIYNFVPDAGQCATPVRMSVTIISPLLSGIVGANQTCVGNPISLTHSTLGGSWSSDNEQIATISNSGILTPKSPGLVTIKYMVSNGSCNTFVLKTIQVNPLPEPVLKDFNLCRDSNSGLLNFLDLYCGLPNRGYAFKWTLNGVILPTSINTQVADTPGFYQVEVTDMATGCTATASCTVGISEKATVKVQATPDFSDNQMVTVTVQGSGVYLFRLDDGLFQRENVFYNLSNGTHTITVKDIKGCDEINLDVEVLNYPRFFTPNGDGYNDSWNIHLKKQNSAAIYIFDRYGKLIKTLNPSSGSSGWDGTFNGHLLPASDYWFKLIYEDAAGSKKEFRAHFALKR